MVLGSGPLGASPLGAFPPHFIQQIDRGRRLVTLTSTAILIPERQTDEGLLIRSIGAAWIEVARFLGDDWSTAYQIDARQWEEMLAGALKKEGFDVTLKQHLGAIDHRAGGHRGSTSVTALS
jgi:restriction system protein